MPVVELCEENPMELSLDDTPREEEEGPLGTTPSLFFVIWFHLSP
jgi:hypothetical protein